MDETAWSAKDNDAAVRSINDDVISDNAVGTAKADTVGPLLEGINAARADIIVLNGDARASEWALGDVKARPGARVV